MNSIKNKSISSFIKSYLEIKKYNTSLTLKLNLGYFFLLVLSISLSSGIIYVLSRDYILHNSTYNNSKIYKDLLIATNKISAERGPTNTLLGGEYDKEEPIFQKLSEFRTNTDLAIDALENELPLPEVKKIKKIRESLFLARKMVDLEINKPFNERTTVSISYPIHKLFDVIDQMLPLVTNYAINYTSKRNSSDEALIAKALLEIRDYAGRLGSILTPYIAKNEKIKNDDIFLIEKYSGRIDQLWDIISSQTMHVNELRKNIVEIDEVFFKVGIPLVLNLVHKSKNEENTYTTKRMTDELVPTLLPLEKMRSEYLSFIIEQSKKDLDSSLKLIICAFLIALIMISINVTLIIKTKSKIFSPLLLAKQCIVLLSEGNNISKHLKQIRGDKEIDEVFNALTILNVRLIERQLITETLKNHAEIDELTGLLNRRAIEFRINTDIDFSNPYSNIGLIIIDIDFFKLVNDKYGHNSGDLVLLSVANVIKSSVRISDIVGRYGGEEFLIVTPDITLVDLFNLAENVRVNICNSKVILTGGNEINVTASLGIAIGKGSQNNWLDLFQKADGALYAAKRRGRNITISDS